MTDSAVATPDVNSSHSESGGGSQHARPRSRTLKALSLYTGAGGLDLGFEAAGFETVAAVEMDPDCVATLQANRDWPLAAESIHDVPSSRLLAMAALREGDADVLIGGPPCQPFSKCGYWATGDARRLADPHPRRRQYRRTHRRGPGSDERCAAVPVQCSGWSPACPITA